MYHIMCNSVVIVVKLYTMDMLGSINCELNDSDVSEVTEDFLSNASNEADLTTVNCHTNCLLQLVLQLALFKVLVRTHSLTCNVCNHHSVCIQCLYYYNYQIFRQEDCIRKIMMQVFSNQCSVAIHIST